MGNVAVVAGLGLIGGSMAKALKTYNNYRVCGWNRTRSVAEKAFAEGAIDGVADEEMLSQCDLLLPALYPQATVAFLQNVIPRMKAGAQVVALAGVKGFVVEAVTPVARRFGIRYTGGHSVAGLEKCGYERSAPDLFQGASMILVPIATTEVGDLMELGALFRKIGFGKIKFCTPQTHDRMIAYTSQLPHVISNSYVKSLVAGGLEGFTGGSCRDMSRTACLNETMWTELFLLNRKHLLPEIDQLLSDVSELRAALEEGDAAGLERLLRRGREDKERMEVPLPERPGA